ncbi:hypothetical protein [Spirillospora sp. CA-128828]|uniref:hypothetical protein n=1 Tax=Spirillospora sp. CA-128828 TaxID=3240033 RepID=UPI003D94B1B5
MGREDVQDLGYGLLEFHKESPPLSTVAADGLRSQDVTALAPVELVCTLWEEQRYIARHFADSLAQTIIHKPSTLIHYGFVVDNDEPLLEGTQVQALLGCPSPSFRDGFDLLKEESGGIKAQAITLLPITSGAAELVRDKGDDALWTSPARPLPEMTRTHHYPADRPVRPHRPNRQSPRWRDRPHWKGTSGDSPTPPRCAGSPRPKCLPFGSVSGMRATLASGPVYPASAHPRVIVENALRSAAASGTLDRGPCKGKRS